MTITVLFRYLSIKKIARKKMNIEIFSDERYIQKLNQHYLYQNRTR